MLTIIKYNIIIWIIDLNINLDINKLRLFMIKKNILASN
jgi:hypothetical protein